MRQLRVAHVITRLCKGGAQENTFHTVRLANRERYAVDLISGPTDGAEGSIEKVVCAEGIEIVRAPHLVRNVSPFDDIRAAGELTRIFRRRRFDIVHTHTSKAGAVGRLAARCARVPALVHTPHGNIFDGYFSPWRTRVFIEIEKRAARWTDRIVELTDGGIDEHLERGIGRRSQYETIFSGIDLSPYDAAVARRDESRRKLGANPNDLLVGGVGRLEPIKGFEYFIQAARLISGAVPGARFILAGQGSVENALRECAAPLGDRFQFLGLRDDVPDLMAAMDVLVVPSINEGMGRVLLEAGAARTPVVASNVGGIPDIVDDARTGVLVPPESPEAIAQVVVALDRDRDRIAKMGAAARARVVPHYGLENMVMRIEAMYEELAKEKSLDDRG